MSIDPALIERIYEAAALPDRWPAVFENIADWSGAIGAALIRRTPDATTMIVSPRLAPHLQAYVAEGWADDPAHAAPLFEQMYPGFRSETDFRSREQIERLPVHARFLGPLGLSPGVGTLLQGARNDSLQLAVQGFGSYAAADRAKPQLDGLRAPLARALSLASRLAERQVEATVTTLDLAGVAAAVVDRDGRLRAANQRFGARLGERIDTTRGRLRFADRFAHASLTRSLNALDGVADGCSGALAPRDGTAGFVLHLLPLRRDARDLFEADGVLILLAEPANASIPGADLLRLLFDLTPAEARLTRLLVEGRSQAEAAALLRVSDNTTRTHLRHVFAKTGVTRQAELVRLLAGLGAPGFDPA